MRNGAGTPVLCRAHQIALEDDPFEQAFDQLDDVMARGTGRLVQGIRAALEGFADRMRNPPQAIPPGAQRPRPRPIPPPPPPPPAAEDPRVVLGFGPGVKLTRAAIKERQRAMAALVHPDKGGSHEAMTRINMAAKKLLEAF